MQGIDPVNTIRTQRLVLRRWQRRDYEPFARLNADPRVMEYMPGPLSSEESDALAQRIETGFERHGFGLWAVEVPGVSEFAGFVGLAVTEFASHFTPAVEIGWRLDAEHWNRGYATESARAVLDLAFGTLGLDEIVSFTVPANHRSRSVMEKIGMTRNAADDFEHPQLPAGHPLRAHVLYRITRRDQRGR